MIDEKSQISIFEKTSTLKEKTSKSTQEWQQEWKDMPEFVQEKQKPYSAIIVRFETEEDLKDFSNLIGQKLTQKTKSIWHPFKSHWGNERNVWIDEP